MSKIEIELRDYYSGGGDRIAGVLDIKDNDAFPLSLNYLIADIKNLALRSGSYSKTFNVPATKNNNDILKHIWNPNTYVDGVSTYQALSHKPLERKPCIVKVGSVPVLRGELKIKNVITKPEGKEYVLQLIGDNSDWVKQLETFYLNELTVFDTETAVIDHTYNKATIEASWSANYTDLEAVGSYAFFYPLINYGSWNNKAGSTKGVEIEDLKPAVYIRAILDAAFQEIGYGINSTFLDAADFKKLIMPYKGEEFRLSEAYISARNYRAGLAIAQQIDTAAITASSVATANEYIVPIANDSTSPNFDTGSLYNTTTYKYVANAPSMMRFKGEIKIYNNNDIDGDFEIFIRKHTGGSYVDMKANYITTVAKGATVVLEFDSNYRQVSNAQEFQLVIKSTYPPILAYVDNTYRHVHKYSVIGQDVDGFHTHIYNEIDTKIMSGQSIVLKDILPNDVTVLDILKGITHMFNLYYRTDTANKIVYIEPRDSFFDATTAAIDWTDKIHIKDYQIQFIDDYNKNLEFKYKRDSDDGHVKTRDEEYVVHLGQYKYVLNDRFQMGEQVFENPTFSPTYHIMDRNIIDSTTPLTVSRHKAPLISMMWRQFGHLDSSQPKLFEFAPRILVKSYGTQEDDDGNNRAWKWEGTSQTSIPTGLMRGYDDVTQDNLSYNGSDGLFQTYYGKFIQIIEKGVLLTALFDLNTQDLGEINLKKPIFISKPSDLHGYYVINKIVDYTPSRTKLTKVELVRIENQGTASFDSEQTGSTRGNLDFGEVGGLKGYDIRKDPFHGGTGVKFDDAEAIQGVDPTATTVVMNNGTNYSSQGSNNSVFGEGNVAKGSGQTIVGKYATIDNDSLFQVGNGNSEDDRSTPLKVDADGELVQFGGQVQAIINDVVVDVLVEDADNERYLKLFKNS